MSLFDFIFPEQAQAMHLREIAESARGLGIEKSRSNDESWANTLTQKQLNRRIKQLEDDKSLLTLVITILLKDYISKNKISPHQLQDLVKSIDNSDGVADGGLDIDELRNILGMEKIKFDSSSNIQICPDCNRAISQLQGKCLYCGYVKLGK